MLDGVLLADVYRFMMLFNLSTTTTTTTDMQEQIVTVKDKTITYMLYDKLCRPCIDVSDTNTGLMESSNIQEVGVDGSYCVRSWLCI